MFTDGSYCKQLPLFKHEKSVIITALRWSFNFQYWFQKYLLTMFDKYDRYGSLQCHKNCFPKRPLARVSLPFGTKYEETFMYLGLIHQVQK
ncbi:hypothetical protein T06_27 [Trichinella sp. T6]|nr:hypothetical protein T06_27 [Trichinella sp. T6]